MKPSPAKPKKCKECKTPFIPSRPLQAVCSPVCGLTMARAKREKDEAKAKAAERKADRVKKESQKSRGEVLAEAKTAIQAFRRLEELSKGRGCISCGRSRGEVESGDWRPGGYWDGGHFKGKGAFPELALEPLNIWLQCKSCNAGSGKYARKGYTVNAAFEAGLVALEGQALVDWLNGPHEHKHYEIDQLVDLRNKYRALASKLKKQLSDSM